MTNLENHVAAEIIELLRAYHAAMVAARADDLNNLLDKDYSLVHITGYVQPKDAWLDVIRNGEFDYHDIEVDKGTLSLKVSGSKATIEGKGVFNATINGMHAPWRLQFEVACSKQDGQWKIIFARYSSCA